MSKILVVDDEPDMIWAITNVLLSENHSVLSVNSGEEALSKIKSTPMDLVLLDFRLPGMDGIQILEKIRAIRTDLPVIMLTGYGGIEEAVQAIKLGAAHYIAKPFDNAQLVEAVNKTLQLGNLKEEGVFGRRLMEKLGSKSAGGPAKSADAGKPPQGKNGILIAGALISALLSAAGIFFWKAAGLSDKEFVIAHSKVSGLAFGEGDLWVTDWFTQTIERYRLAGGRMELVKTATFPGYHLTGIAYGGGALFTCDSWKKMIFKHSLDDRFSIEESVPSPGPEPSGLFFDGKYLWSCDGKTRKIYMHALDKTLTVLETYDSQALFPTGLYHDSLAFWTAGAFGMKLYKNLFQERFRPEKAYVFEELLYLAKPISGFTVKDGKFWIAFEGINRIYERDPRKLKETAP